MPRFVLIVSKGEDRGEVARQQGRCVLISAGVELVTRFTGDVTCCQHHRVFCTCRFLLRHQASSQKGHPTSTAYRLNTRAGPPLFASAS